MKRHRGRKIQKKTQKARNTEREREIDRERERPLQLTINGDSPNRERDRDVTTVVYNICFLVSERLMDANKVFFYQNYRDGEK